MLGALVAMTAFIFITFFAQNLVMLLIGEFLCVSRMSAKPDAIADLCPQAMPWGVFQTLSVAFASEICPVALRPYLTTYVPRLIKIAMLTHTADTSIYAGYLASSSEPAFLEVSSTFQASGLSEDRLRFSGYGLSRSSLISWL